MANFKEVKVVDNFYQNSLFFPMPTVAISTLDEEVYLDRKRRGI